jgi:pimeloyl-ACP methyl ester carboxylesterase
MNAAISKVVRAAAACLTLLAAGLVSAPAGAQQVPAGAAGVSLRTVDVGPVTLRIAEMGEGPLVLLVHGWPESWYSWRRQMPALAAAGYRVVAPDMRGYGASDRPASVDDYDIRKLSGDLVGLLDALGEKSAILVGHDWGAIVAWNSMLLHPDRFTALAAMSVPFSGRAASSPLESMRRTYGDNFYYILYFQEPGVAEAEFDADPRGILSRLYTSPDTPVSTPAITDPKRAAGGWIPRLGQPLAQPPWLSREDLDYYVGEFSRAGFRGGINYYRNFHRNWEITPELAGARISQPVAFIAGEQDIVIRGASADALTASMKRAVDDLRSVTLIPGAGHWVQQEKPDEVNAALLAFLGSLPRQDR